MMDGSIVHASLRITPALHRATPRRLAAFLLPLVAAVACAQPPTGPVKPTGQTPPARGWKAVTLIDKLEHPWGMAWLPSGEILITERPGRVRVVRDGKLVGEPSNVPDVLAFGQGGLMDVSLHPKFGDNKLVYLTHSAGDRGGNHTVLVRARFEDGTLKNFERLFAVSQKKPGGQHFGSRLLWMPDGTLLMSIGDGGNPPVRVDGEFSRLNAQKLDSHLGKVLRLTDEGRPAPGNPFAGKDGAKAEIWTYGHRNIQGLARDPESGNIWATEHGALGGDELNLLAAGSNYGWPEITYSREYSGATITEERSREGMVDPAVVWTPCIAPSGLVYYTGDKFPAWRGDLLAGGLVLKQIRRVDLEGGRVAGEETLQFDDRIRDVRQGPDGYLYVLTDEDNGKLMRLEPD